MTIAFADQSDRLFGRQPDLKVLVSRADMAGLTVVAGRPLMGKTWVLLEMARRLTNDGHFIVGYHEYKGGESSHLLYAVSKLYEQWLDDSSMREQAVSIWERHKQDLVPAAGKLVGNLFHKLSGSIPGSEGIGSLVKGAFDVLSDAATDLKSGGLRLAPLAYDDALSLVRLVAQVSGRKPILILDAWEKSTAQQVEHQTLETFLAHLDEWAGTHVYLAIRDPAMIGDHGEAPIGYARQLARFSPSAQIHSLGAMDLADREGERISRFVREQIPAAAQISDRDLVDLTAGYPGVLNFWLNSSKRTQMSTRADFAETADEAQRLRYTEIDRLLQNLSDSDLQLVARIASLPRLNGDTWQALQSLVLEKPEPLTLDKLANQGLFESRDVPTFDHDTRHRAVRQCFVAHFRNYFKEQVDQMVRALAARCTSQKSVVFLESLAAASEIGEMITLNPTIECLIWAAQSVFSDDKGIFTDRFDLLYQQTACEVPGSAALICMALINRASGYGTKGNVASQSADLEAAIALPGAPEEIRAQALYNRGLMRGQLDQLADAIADFSSVLAIPRAPFELLARARCNLGVSKELLGEVEGALKEYDTLIVLPDCPAEPLAKALYGRSRIRIRQKDTGGALADHSAVIDMLGAPVADVMWARNDRGHSYIGRGELVLALADFDAVIVMPGATNGAIGFALYYRGVVKGMQGNDQGELIDYTAAINLRGARAQDVAMALIDRGVLKYKRKDYLGAETDYSRALKTENLGIDYRALALYNRGVVRKLLGNTEAALADYHSVIETPDAPACWVGQALCNRSEIKVHQEDLAGACKDLQSAIDLPDSPEEVVTHACARRKELACGP
jgi:tetratricopeptide (TPR) repeat protein